jgi:hypothetical protein
MATPDLKEIHDFLVSLAFKAGDIITNAILDNNDTGSKKNSTGRPDERGWETWDEPLLIRAACHL